ncbi:hypothetical protein EVAR_2579_1 [Eumeta japonica]|uniref:Uncharacterized protein n=1 Tax=Eumeta variegata TaxID=151549 RepID=A0A4C1SLL6_EUMVA|nr:hypothetical protein EVAR_2579_1 [Eumeta japonica]
MALSILPLSTRAPTAALGRRSLTKSPKGALVYHIDADERRGLSVVAFLLLSTLPWKYELKSSYIHIQPEVFWIPLFQMHRVIEAVFQYCISV